MLKIINGEISMTRGDTGIFNVLVYYPKILTKEEYILREGDVVVFTLRRKNKTSLNEDYILKKTFVNNQIKLNPSDTASLEYGDYYYDVQLTFANGDVNTIIPCNKFILCDEVS